MRLYVSAFGRWLDLKTGRDEPDELEAEAQDPGSVTACPMRGDDWVDPLVPNDEARTFGFY